MNQTVKAQTWLSLNAEAWIVDNSVKQAKVSLWCLGKYSTHYIQLKSKAKKETTGYKSSTTLKEQNHSLLFIIIARSLMIM